MTHTTAAYCKKGDQSHAEWEELDVKGPNFGLNANFLEHGSCPNMPREAGVARAGKLLAVAASACAYLIYLAYAKALEPDTSFSDGLALIKGADPVNYLKHGESIRRNLAFEKKEKFKHKYFMEDFLRPPLILPLYKSILLHGASGTGKTHFACAHFQNPLVVSHMDDLKHLDPTNDGIVFDDMSFTNRPIEGVIHLVDREFARAIHCRHVNAKIPANMPKIFTHNTPNPFYSDLNPPTEEQRKAVSRRVEVWRVPAKLFKHPLSKECVLVRERIYDDGLPLKPQLRREQERVYHSDGQ